VACALLALLIPLEPLQVVLAIPLALFLPGYAVTAATFARTPTDRPRLLVLSLGMSLSILALGSLVLNYVPGGIRAGSWALLLVLVTIAASRAAALRRPGARSAGKSFSPPRVGRMEGGLLAVGIVAAVAAIALAFVPLGAEHALGYTEMSIQPTENGGEAAALISVGSEEKQRTAYLLSVRSGGQTPIVRRFALDPGQSQTLHFGVEPEGVQPVVASLYRAMNPGHVYRRVSDWIGAPGGAG
jgi:hypothetical protein